MNDELELMEYKTKKTTLGGGSNEGKYMDVLKYISLVRTLPLLICFSFFILMYNCHTISS